MTGFTPLDVLLALCLAATIALYLVGGRRGGAVLAVALHGAILLVVVGLGLRLAGGATSLPSSVTFSLMGQSIGWAMDGYGWFFALLAAGAAFFASIFMLVEPDRRFERGTLALNLLAMMVMLASNDFLSLFIGWEMVSWAAFLMMTQAGGRAAASALRYLLYALVGAMALLAAILIIRTDTGSFAFPAFTAAFAGLPALTRWGLVALFTLGFGVKIGLVPAHLWQAEAYARTPAASSVFLNSVAARMGLFALILVLAKVIGLSAIARMSVGPTGISARELLMWVAAVTMVVPTYIALMQTDARLLLAWHGIGQSGYMLLGILVATPLGVSGGLLHVFNHATYQAVLVMAVMAVVHRTGTADLDRLGGLINRMPLTYVALLLGIIGLAGLPPMNGFVSKWMIYKALLDSHAPVMFLFAVIGTLGTILSVYKLIHNIFLGQLRAEHRAVRDAPWPMAVPMLALAGLALVTGIVPGAALDVVDLAQSALGVAVQPHTLGGVTLANGSLDMRWVVGVMVGAMIFSAFVFYLLGNRSRRVHQWDNYVGGHFLSADIRYHFSHDFYPGLVRVIGPLYRGWVVRAVRALGNLVTMGAQASQGLFRMAYTPFYVIVVLTLALAWAGMAGGH